MTSQIHVLPHYSHKDSNGQIEEEEVAQEPEIRSYTCAKSAFNLLEFLVPQTVIMEGVSDGLLHLHKIRGEN